ncbi:MAG: ParA family protein [bacterium]|nr:ParA family protein [bacterium]
MARIIVIANQKGGVAKTTTAINLAMGLAAAETRVLLIDLDPQSNATSGLGVDPAEAENTTYEVIIGETPINDATVREVFPYLDVVPAHKRLTGAEIELVSIVGRETLLRDRIDTARGEYDYVLIDCPPSLGLLTLNGLVAADSALIPIQCEYFALEGLSSLLETIELVRNRLNTTLAIEGVVLTMYDARTNLSAQVAEEVRRHFGDKVYKTIIPRSVRLSEAPSFGLPILLYDAASAGAQAYMNLVNEVLSDDHQKSAG